MDILCAVCGCELGEHPTARGKVFAEYSLSDGLFRVSPGDLGVRALADRHYTRKHPGKGTWWSPALTLCLTNAERTVVFAWQWPKTEFRRDGQEGYNCVLFRNESERLASDIILEAEAMVVATWGPGRAYTYVDAIKIQSSNPGYCYLKAGWMRIGISKSGKVLLEKELA